VTITFRQRSLPLDIDFQRHRLSDFQGSAVVGLPNRNQVLFTLGTRQHLPADLRRVKLGTDRVDRLSGIGGDLRAGVELRARLWLLAMYRLHELRVDPIELIETYAVPKYGWGLLPLFGGTKLALTRINQKRVPVFSLSSRSIEKNLPMAYPQLAIDGPNETTLFSFWDERARTFDEQLAPRGRARQLPVGITPLASPGAIHFVSGERRVFANVSPPDPRIKWVYSLERVMVFAPSVWEVLAEGPLIRGLEELMGYDAAGRLIGRSDDEIVLVHAGKLTEVARHACGATITAAAQATPSGIAFRTGSRQGDELRLVEWSDEPADD
jgi:hypothetical protein